MDSSAMALTGILVLVILTLPLGPSWFMVFPVLIGMIAFSWHRRRRRRLTEDQGLPLYTPPPARDDQSPAGDASRPAGDDQSPPGDASRRAGDDQPSAPAPDPAGGASPPPGPLPAGSAPPPAVDALVPSGKKRSEPESSSTPSPSSGFKHDVYLNFRAEDTRKGFTDLLHHKLEMAGIRVFRDDRELHLGDDIGVKILEVIKRSRISIAILSKYYASSKWCLDELVQMWECRESNGQIIIPIFDGVRPLDVIHQAEAFGRSFNLHEMDKVDSTIIETWRAVLRQIGKLSGYERENRNWRRDDQLIEQVVARVAHVLKEDDQVVTDELVGIDFQVEEVMRELGVDYSKGQAVGLQGNDVRILGLYGMGGIGKTTLAKAVYNKVHKLFNASSFLENVSSKGLPFLQRKLIADLQKQILAPLESSGEGIEEVASLYRDKKFLIVLDDVWEDEATRILGGKFTLFGPGSRIIVTTRNKDFFNAFDVKAVDSVAVVVHEVQPMSDKHALELFRKHAFQGIAPEDVSECDSLSEDIVKAMGGNPSTIERHAKSLRHMNIDVWKTTLDLLQNHPKDRQAALQISNAEESELESSSEDD